MNYIYKFFCFLCHKFLNKIYIIKILFCRYSESCIIVSLVYNVLRSQPISSRLCKCFKCRNGNTCSISKPFYKFFFSKIIKYQRKMIKKCCKSHYISIRIFLQPFFQIITHKNIRRRLSYIKGNVMRLVTPVICNMVVHLSRIPNHIS